MIQYSSPVPVGSRFTSGFMTKARPSHSGTDYAPPKPGQNVPITAVSDGVVKKVGNGNVLRGHTGLGVLIDHGKRTGNGSTDLVETYYGHLNSYSVKRGQYVKAGQVIGYMGTTGNSTGVHLHLSVLFNGKLADPAKWLKTKGIKPGVTAPVKTATGYVVKAGDTLSGIAARHNTTVSALQKLNKITNVDRIAIGQRIRLS